MMQISGKLMSMLVQRNRSLLLMLSAILAVTLPLVSSCGLFGDPSAKTEGYKLFTGRSEGLSISFEYPETWNRDPYIESHEKSYTLSIYSGNSITGVNSNVNATHGGDYENAHALLQDQLDSFSKSLDFKLLSQGKSLLGKVEGEEVTYSWRLEFLDEHTGRQTDKAMVEKHLAADYEERIYHINIFADADKYEELKECFEHIIATFKFLK